jgi:hypothetical protein
MSVDLKGQAYYGIYMYTSGVSLESPIETVKLRPGCAYITLHEYTETQVKTTGIGSNL